MIAIKTKIKIMPECCDDCQWYECRPHPYRGWSEGCGLMMHCMDDDQPEEWIYDGDGRPKACPLIEMEGDEETIKDVTDESKCCCSCKHNIRTFDDRYNCTIKCDKDGHYIGYASNFVSVCDEWEGDAE